MRHLMEREHPAADRVRHLGLDRAREHREAEREAPSDERDSYTRDHEIRRYGEQEQSYELQREADRRHGARVTAPSERDRGQNAEDHADAGRGDDEAGLAA